MATASRLTSIAPDGPYGQFISGLAQLYGKGDLPAGIREFEGGLNIDPNDHEAMCILAIAYFDIGESGLANNWLEKARQMAPDATFVIAADAYGFMYRGDIGAARKKSLDAIANEPQLYRWSGGFMAWRYVVDELIDRGEPTRAVDLVLQAEPDLARFRDQSPRPAQPSSGRPPSWVGTSVDAMHFLPDLARALRAAGDDRGADNVLAHLDTILNYFLDQEFLLLVSRLAELHALRGNNGDALDALERAEKSGTLYSLWQYQLSHNRIFDGIRDEPRYVALVDRVKAEMQRQRIELRNNRPRSNQIPL